MKRSLAIAASFVLTSSLGCNVLVMTPSTTSSTGASGGAGGAASSSTSSGGACVPVDDHDPCTDDACADGVPVHLPRADGIACAGADACVMGAACQAGACVGGAPLACNGGASCVAGACVAPSCSGAVGLPGVPQLAVGTDPSSLAAADLNGDGRPDLVVANAGDDTVSVLLVQGNGTFAPAVVLGVGAHPTSVAVADLNGDGQPDLVVANGDEDSVSVLINQGAGAFAPAVHYAAGAGPSSVALADLSGDGRPDLAVADADGSTVSVLINAGDGTFSLAVALAVGAGPISVAAGDLNGDGKIDLVVAGKDSHAVSVLLNQGGGAFAPAVDYAAGAGPSALALADLNGDGKPDLAVTNIDSSPQAFASGLSVLQNQGDGTFAPAGDYGLGWAVEPFRAVAAVDLDGDGWPDLAAVSSNGGGTVRVLLNQGDGTFGNLVAAARYGAGDGARSIAVADLTGDGRPDLAIVGSSTVTVVQNQGHGAFGVTSDIGSGGCHVAVTADLNGDGRPDLTVLNCAASTMSVLINQGDGTFAQPVETTLGEFPFSLAAADLNGDGWTDLAVADRDTAKISVLRNQGDGTFAPAVDYAADPNSTWPSLNSVRNAEAIAAADLDGDGKPDLAVAYSNPNDPGGWSNGVRVLRNQGDGTFVLGSDSAVHSAPSAMVAMDLNGDGMTDLAILTISGDVSVMINQGNADFAPAEAYGGGWSSLVAADLNGDGKPDLVCPGNDGVMVLLNHGDGTFAPAVGYPADLNLQAVVAADLNGDGKLDLVVSNYGSNTVSVLLNHGDGTFAPALGYATMAGPGWLAAADLNGDGRTDLAVIGVDTFMSLMFNVCLP